MLTEAYKNLWRLQPGKAPGQIFFVTRAKEKIPVALTEADAGPKLRGIFKEWAKEDAPQARKAAFDYGSDERGMKWIWLVLSVFMVGGIGTLFAVDGLHTRHCTKLMEATGQLATAQVTKVKKDRRGQYLWDLVFQTADGQTIKGRRPGQHMNREGLPSTDATVIYAPSDVSCWDVSVRSGEKVLPFGSRWFGEKFTFGFGLFFWGVALISTLFSLRALLERRPFRQVLRQISEEI